MRAPSILLVACVAAAGCGGGDEPVAQRPQVPVAIDLRAPSDTAVVRRETVNVRGTVEPAGAAVRVDGRAAEVAGGRFTIEVPLDPGANVIDVIATARGRASALTAVRVTREVPIEVPELDGLEVAEAESRLADAGLRAELEEGGGIFDGLLGGEPAVCEQEPEAGAEVWRGTAVRVTVARRC